MSSEYSVIHKRAVAYSLLAHINNSGNLSKGPLDIFVPIVKKSLHYLCSAIEKPKGESIKEISDVIAEIFALDIPIPVLRNILRMIQKEVNTNDEVLFTLNKDDSFWIHDYIFVDYDEQLEHIRREIKNLQTLFDKFCEMNNVKSGIGIVQFIEKNKISISTYLANKPSDNIYGDFSIEAKFVDYFKNASPVIYEQIRNLYLGTILTSYLEYCPDNVKMGVDLLLDTNFIISLIDLNTEESTHTCRKLLEVGKQIGYSFHILIDTIEEAIGLLRFKADNFNKSVIQKYVNREDIYNACHRLKYNKTDLERVADNLQQSIEQFGIYIVYQTSSLKNKARITPEYNALKKCRNTEKAALHDAMCIEYVKEKRGKNNSSRFEDINCWWVNNAITHDSENEDVSAFLSTSTGSHLPEMIKVDDLLNILWLSCPNLSSVDVSSIIEIGLSSLIAYTFSQSLPKARIIKELDDNIQKYKNSSITDRDVLMLATRVANGQIRDIEKMNELAHSDSERFNERIKEEAAKQEKIEQERGKILNDIVSQFTSKIEELSTHKKYLEEVNENKIRQVISQTQNKHDSEIAEKDLEIAALKEKLRSKENSRRKELRDRYIRKEIKKWRWKLLGPAILFGVLFVFGFVYLLIICKDVDLAKKFSYIIDNQLVTLILSFVFMLIEIILIKPLVARYDVDKLKTFTTLIEVPEDLKEV